MNTQLDQCTYHFVPKQTIYNYNNDCNDFCWNKKMLKKNYAINIIVEDIE